MLLLQNKSHPCELRNPPETAPEANLLKTLQFCYAFRAPLNTQSYAFKGLRPLPPTPKKNLEQLGLQASKL